MRWGGTSLRGAISDEVDPIAGFCGRSDVDSGMLGLVVPLEGGLVCGWERRRRLTLRLGVEGTESGVGEAGATVTAGTLREARRDGVLGLGVRSAEFRGGFSEVALGETDWAGPLRSDGSSAFGGVDMSDLDGSGCGSLPSLIAGLLGGRPPPLPPRPRAPLPLKGTKADPGSPCRGLFQSRDRDEG